MKSDVDPTVPSRNIGHFGSAFFTKTDRITSGSYPPTVVRGSGGSSVSPTGHSRSTEDDRVPGSVSNQPRQNGREHGYGAVDPDREQVAGCIHAARGAHAARFTTNRGGRRAERREKFRSRELRREVSIPVPYRFIVFHR